MKKTDVQKIGSILFYSDQLGRFDFGPDHPFKPERIIKTYELCNRYGVLNYPWMTIRKPEILDADLLSYYHQSSYLNLLKEASQGIVKLEMLAHGLGTEDTPILKGIYEWVLQATAGTFFGMKALLEDTARAVFNPFGGFHHAMPDNAEGFCYVNDIVIAIMDALKNSPETRIAYVDIDAHHGNGVQHAFFNDPRVLVISLHETGRTLYPWSGFETEIGEKKGKGYTLNIPLEPGTDDEVYNFVLKEAVFPILESFSPDIIVGLFGADTLVSDPLTHLKLTNNGYQNAIKGIIAVCPRILGLGGGGYDLFKTSRAWTLAWSLLNQVEPVDEFAGLVGGMMFGPEMEMGSLYDHPFETKGEVKENAMKEARRVTSYIKETLFPIHNV